MKVGMKNFCNTHTPCTCLLIMFLAFYCIPISGQVLIKDDEQKLNTHPRLIFTKSLQKELMQKSENDKLLQSMIKEIHRMAKVSMQAPLIDYQSLVSRPHRTSPEALAGKYVLDIASLTGSRLFLLSTSYRLSNDPDQKSMYLQRILKEIDAVSSLPDWNPGQFLDVAELALGMAITYDWLFAVLPDPVKDQIEKDLITKAIEPGIQAYEDSARWISRYNNWTQVCNSGLVVAALAIGDKYPAICNRMLNLAHTVMPKAMQAIYAPNGVYQEGPSYWQYGTTFNVLLIEALQTALNTNWGLTDTSGFAQTGDFQIHSISPTYRYFNYADAPEEARLAPVLFKLSDYFDKPTYSGFLRTWLSDIFSSRNLNNSEPVFTLSGSLSERKTARFYPLSIIWYQSDSEEKAAIPKCASFSGVAVMRSAWFDNEAFYFGIKEGENGVSHSHLDLGSFVMDAAGIRWAVDLGREVYNLPGMFDYASNGKRWSYYRMGTLSHNTLVINEMNQQVAAKATLLETEFTNDKSFAKLDLSEAYQGYATSVVRAVTMEGENTIIIHDKLNGLENGDKIRWGMLTRATVQIAGNHARLHQEGKTLYAKIQQPRQAHFQVISTQPQNEAEKQNIGTHMLGVNISAMEPELQIKIKFSTKKLK